MKFINTYLRFYRYVSVTNGIYNININRNYLHSYVRTVIPVIDTHDVLW